MYRDMDSWVTIRRRVLVEGVSKRQILRETGLHWVTLEKILANDEPPGYRRREPRPRPRVGPYLDRIRQIIAADQEAPRKQRHTAKRIFERLREEGYTGGYTQVKAVVREIQVRRQEVFVPLVHRPGEAQADVGHALIKQDGVLRKVVFFVFVLPYSDAICVQVFERSCLETFAEAHSRAFTFFGGVPRRITYDNDGVLVAGVMAGRERRLTHGFLRLKSHYLFDTHFCQVRRPNEKGVVESMVKYARLNFLVPVPEVRDLEALNAELAARCRVDLERRLRGKPSRKGVLLGEDQAAFLPMPATPFEACRTVSTTASSLSLARFDGNDYSVPVRYAHHPVVMKGFVDRVAISHQGQAIASHRRLWTKEDVSFDPVHYLALLERKPGALDHARPLADWDLPAGCGVLRRRLEDERGGEGTREYIRVLRLLETRPLPAVTAAVEQALRVNALTRDAIAQFLLPREDWRQTTFRLDGHEHLRHVRVAPTAVTAYTALLTAGGVP